MIRTSVLCVKWVPVIRTPSALSQLLASTGVNRRYCRVHGPIIHATGERDQGRRTQRRNAKISGQLPHLSFVHTSKTASHQYSTIANMTDFRLPTDVKPTHYDLTIRTDLEEHVFEGRVKIECVLCQLIPLPCRVYKSHQLGR
jgi:hypothetical protein